MAEIAKEQKEDEKLYQDQLYGAKILSPLAVAIIDTPEFQRLAGLRQLGFTHFVYRGANHTRICHSIGTYLLSRTIMRRIAQNHMRLPSLGHPGDGLPKCFAMIPDNAYPKDLPQKKLPISNQSLWRGLMEVVSAAALLHDVSHVPFGHTFEDEFPGIYNRHDSLGGPRLYELMFNQRSNLRALFSRPDVMWICEPSNKTGIKNEELAQLIYVILNWKEKVNPPTSFETLLQQEKRKLNSTSSNPKRERLENLEKWYLSFKRRSMFHPFMSDIIGNTICADLFDYLPRDRMNLGMEYRSHSRLQRYLTIREGRLYKGEGKRVCIMVTRRGRGGQRRDVATAVLDIMRERYEMAERVYYHHKKAAASSMLANLMELCPQKLRPLDDESLYPAPWALDHAVISSKNIIHFSDDSLIDYLGHVKIDDRERIQLQRQLYIGLRYDRNLLYRTLLVVDTDLLELSARTISYFAKDLREDNNAKPSNIGRQKLERELAEAAGAPDGSVLVYCPSPGMQSKEVDARLEIVQDRVLPLRVQQESFTYNADVRVLQSYYQQLWRIYIFVTPTIYSDRAACLAIVDKFCDLYGIEKMIAYSKVRKHDFKIANDVIASKAIEPLIELFRNRRDEGLPFRDTPAHVMASVLSLAAIDDLYLGRVKAGSDLPYCTARLAALYDIVILRGLLEDKRKSSLPQDLIRVHIDALTGGETDPCIIALVNRNKTDKSSALPSSFKEYSDILLDYISNQK